jgi:transcriptional regulator with XRE-family HTH domain
MTQAELARRLGVSRQAVTAWLNGSKPDADSMAKIEDLLGIPMRAWAEEAAPSQPASTGTDDE